MTSSLVTAAVTPGNAATGPSHRGADANANAQNGGEPFGALIARAATQHASEQSAQRGVARRQAAEAAAQGSPEDASTAQSTTDAAPTTAEVQAATTAQAPPKASAEAPPDAQQPGPAVDFLAALSASTAAVDAATFAALPVVDRSATAPAGLDDTPGNELTVSWRAAPDATPDGELTAMSADILEPAAPGNGESAMPAVSDRSASRGPNPGAFARANGQAQAALAAAGAKRSDAASGTPPLPSTAAAGADVPALEFQDRSLPAALIQAPRGDAGAVPAFAQGLAAATAALGGPAASQSPAHASVGTPITHPGFSQEFGDKLLWLVKGQVSNAEISLTPADLGPVRVSIELRGNDAAINFGAAAAATRAIIEDALPRLREMLAQQGLNLTDASVGQHPRRDSQRDGATPTTGRRERALATDVAAAPAAMAPAVRSLRLIDVIA